MRFVCDHDIDSEVAGRLRQLGHQAWTAAEAGLSDAADDSLTVYVCGKAAVLLTHDREFSQPRRRNVVGKPIWLRCREWEAADLLADHLDELLPLLNSTADVFVSVSVEGYQVSRAWK